MIKKTGRVIEKIREKEEYMDFPDFLWEVLNNIEDNTIYTTDPENFQPLSRAIDSVKDEELKELLKEAMDLGYFQAELHEFSRACGQGQEGPVHGPSFRIQDGHGGWINVYPSWEPIDPELPDAEGELRIRSEDVHLDVLLYDGPANPDIIIEALVDYLEGKWEVI